MEHRWHIAGLCLALILLTSACGSGLFGQYYGDYVINSVSLTPAEIRSGEIVRIDVAVHDGRNYGHNDDDPGVDISTTAGLLYSTREEAEGGAISEASAYSGSGTQQLNALYVAWWVAPDAPQRAELRCAIGGARALKIVDVREAAPRH